MTHSSQSKASPRSGQFGLTLAALGVVFGDIGTSPLYALKESFHSSGIPISDGSVLGVLSLITWTLITVITIKYLCLILHADNNGEGGELALMALAAPQRRRLRARRSIIITLLGMCGAALLYGDGIITPAISVLSAVEGLRIVAPQLEFYIIPLTIFILVFLFSMQCHGTSRIGMVFGPIILVWYFSIGILGLIEILKDPAVFAALNPLYAVRFFLEHGSRGFATLGGIFLVATGGEALYADMGHFGRKPISRAWMYVAFPGLILNYYGQGSLLLRNHEAVRNPFFLLAPDWFGPILLVLSAMATVIASQAVISGAFSITRQAVQLGLLPRMDIRHTSSNEIGQVYVSPINWMLLIFTIILVLSFQTSSRLASAYGVGVSTTMVITTVLFFFVVQRHWNWSMRRALLTLLPIIIIDLSFWSSNALKLPHGGWVALLIGATALVIMTTWRRGREILAERMMERMIPLDAFIKQFHLFPRIAGTAVFMTRNVDLTPPALVHNVQYNKVLHERIIFVIVEAEEIPEVPQSERLEIEALSEGFYRVFVHFGYREDQDIPQVMRELERRDQHFRAADVVYFLGRETVLATGKLGMALWRERLFAFMTRNSQSATKFFKLPAERVFEIGQQIEI